MSLSQITDAVIAADAAKNALYRAVQDARLDHTWQEIADTLGISRQAAHERFARPAPSALDPAHTADCLDHSYRDAQGMHLCRPHEPGHGVTMLCAWGHCAEPEYSVWVLRSSESDRFWMVGRCEQHQDDPPPLLPGMEVIGTGGDPEVVRSMDWSRTPAVPEPELPPANRYGTYDKP